MEVVKKHKLKDVHQMNFQQIEDVSRLALALLLNNVEIFSLLFGILLFVLLVKLEFGQILLMNVKLVLTTTLSRIMMEFKLGLVQFVNKIRFILNRKVV